MLVEGFDVGSPPPWIAVGGMLAYNLNTNIVNIHTSSTLGRCICVRNTPRKNLLASPRNANFGRGTTPKANMHIHNV
jgi:hypothetical protein